MHAAVDTLGHLLALHVTPADEQDREQQIEKLAEAVQERGIRLEVVKNPESKRDFVLLPRR